MKHPSSYTSSAFIAFAIIVLGIVTAQQGLAWTNPTSNPPTGTPAITISGTNIGIGVSPSAKLHVVGAESRFGGVASGYISLYNASGRSGYIQANQGTDLRIAADSDPMTFYTGGSERVRINAAGNFSIGTPTSDANYKITTANGGIKADANTGQAAGYFNNIGGGPAIIAGTGGITLGGVNRTSWATGADNLGNHTATAALDMSGNDITALRNLTLSGTMTPNAVGTDSGLTGARHYQFGYQEGGAWVGPYPDLILGYHTGLKLGAYNGYGGTRFYNDHPSISSVELMSIGNGDNHVRISNNLYVTGVQGIGTADPAAQMAGTQGLAIYKNTYPAVGLKNDTSSWLMYGVGTQLRFWNVSAGDFMTADTAGNMAIGSTTPGAYKLNVNGNANATQLCIAGDCKSSWPTGTDSTKVLKTGDTMTGNLNFGSVGLGSIGVYDPTKTQAVWSMGSAYVLPAGGGTTSYGSLYGLGWSYEPDYGAAGNNPQSKAGLSHQLLVMHNGVTKTAIGSGVWTSGDLTFSKANPYINSSSYFIAPGGAYFNSGTVYFAAAIQARGGIHDDNNANLSILGGTSGNTTFSGNITTTGTVSAGAVYNPTYAP